VIYLENNQVSINDTLAFPLMSTGDDLIAMVVVGRNVIDSLEQFSENFEIETAIAIGEKALTVHDYYEEERSPELNTLIRAGLSHATETGTYSYSFIAEKKALAFLPSLSVRKSGPVTYEF
jgi:hypothetical protein